MGKKADALRDELDVAEAELQAQQAENARLRELLVAAAGGNPLTAMIRSSGRGTVSMAADEDPGVEPGSSLEQDPAVVEAMAAIAELRNPTTDPAPKERLVDIVRHNNQQRDLLQNNQRASNTLISRIASALQVPRWDADGAEVLEKAQRFSVFVHFLSKRLKAALAEIPPVLEVVPKCEEGVHKTECPGCNYHAAQASGDRARVVVDELRAIISALVAPPQLSKFLHEKSPARVTPGIFDTALDPDMVVGDINRADVLMLRDAWSVAVAERNRPSGHLDWLITLTKSEVAIKEFVDIVNLLVVPTINRLKIRS